jgi:hypothetical protein
MMVCRAKLAVGMRMNGVQLNLGYRLCSLTPEELLNFAKLCRIHGVSYLYLHILNVTESLKLVTRE